MFAVIGAPEAIMGLIVVLVLFGGSQVPKLARNLGRAQKEFKQGFDEGNKGGGDAAVEAAEATEKAEK